MIFLATMQPVKTLPEPFSGMGVNIDKALKEVDLVLLLQNFFIISFTNVERMYFYVLILLCA